MGYTIVQKGTAAAATCRSVLRVGNYLFVARNQNGAGALLRYDIASDGTLGGLVSLSMPYANNMCVSPDGVYLYVAGGGASVSPFTYAIRISDMSTVATSTTASGHTSYSVKDMECDSLGNIHITTNNPSAAYRVGQFNGSAFTFATVYDLGAVQDWALTVNGSQVFMVTGPGTSPSQRLRLYDVGVGGVTLAGSANLSDGVTILSAPCIVGGKLYAIADRRYLREFENVDGTISRVGTSELDLGVAFYERAAYDGTYIYAYRNESGSSNITIIDPATFSIVRTFPLSGVATTGVGVRIVHRYGANGIVWCNTGNVYSGDTTLVADFTLSATSISAGQTITATAI